MRGIDMIKKNTLYFRLMKPSYFNDYKSLDEFQEDHLRGHGIMILDVDDLLVAIPLRSGIPAYMKQAKHIFFYEIYIKENKKECLKALDFSKLTIIEEKYLDNTRTYIFKDEKEKQFYLNNFNRIYSRVNSYVSSYKKICKNIEEGKAITSYTLKPYRYSTLRNFHKELNIKISKEDFTTELDKIFK